MGNAQLAVHRAPHASAIIVFRPAEHRILAIEPT
jgi:hypothetical protein